MSVDIGIIGLAKSGKTSIFSALTGTKETDLAPHIGTAKVPDPRLKALADTLHPTRVVPTEVRFIDIAASAKGLTASGGIGGELLAQLSTVDALIAVVRAFHDDSVPHVQGSLDIDRDIAAINLELAFSDLSIIEKRLGRIDESLKGAKPPERDHLHREQELLSRIKASLEKEVPVRAQVLSPDEVRIISNYQFLTAKPLLITVNIGEEQLAEAASLEAELNKKYSQPKCWVVALCGKLEKELAQLDEATATEFRAGFNLKESGRDRTLKLAYELLGLVSFFTIVSGEVKAWPVQNGAEALKAAGRIHSDMERGFIRAEVIGYEELIKCGSLAEARKRGALRLEGKTYIVKDGDVITFLFNV